MRVLALLEGSLLSAQEAVEQATLAALAIALLDALMEFDPIGMRLREGFYHTTKILVKLAHLFCGGCTLPVNASCLMPSWRRRGHSGRRLI